MSVEMEGVADMVTGIIIQGLRLGFCLSRDATKAYPFGAQFAVERLVGMDEPPRVVMYSTPEEAARQMVRLLDVD